jgi:hypothetical protein
MSVASQMNPTRVAKRLSICGNRLLNHKRVKLVWKSEELKVPQ